MKGFLLRKEVYGCFSLAMIVTLLFISLQAHVRYGRMKTDFRTLFYFAPDGVRSQDEILSESLGMMNRFRNTSVYSNESMLNIAIQFHWNTPARKNRDEPEKDT